MLKEKMVAILSISLLLGLIISCRKDIGRPQFTAAGPLTDADLYNNATNTADYSYYKSTLSITPSSKETAHGPWFKLRFNSIAAAALTDNGKLPVGASFPEGSVVVKELYQAQTGGLIYLAVMQKMAAHANAREGWLWAEFDDKGKAVQSIGNNGAACVSCHSNNDRDKVRAFELFP